MKKALLIQPHSDDILFSCSHILSGKGKKKFDSVEILTVENNPKRLLEDAKLLEHYPKLKKIHTLDVQIEDNSYYGYYKLHNEINDEIIIGHLTNYFGEKTLLQITDQLVEFVEEWMKDASQEGFDCTVYCCLGIGHPFHRFVKLVLDEYIDYYYREWPHSYKKRNQPDFKAIVQGMKFAYEVDDEVMHNEKFAVAKKIYKTQSGLLFFEQGYIKKMLPEEIYQNG